MPFVSSFLSPFTFPRAPVPQAAHLFPFVLADSSSVRRHAGCTGCSRKLIYIRDGVRFRLKSRGDTFSPLKRAYDCLTWRTTEHTLPCSAPGNSTRRREETFFFEPRTGLKALISGSVTKVKIREFPTRRRGDKMRRARCYIFRRIFPSIP